MCIQKKGVDASKGGGGILREKCKISKSEFFENIGEKGNS